MIDTKTHGIIDYVTGALLIIAPYLFGFANGGVQQWLPQLLGAMIIVMSLITKYELSAAKVIPLKAHLSVDVLGGVLLAASPWLFGFADVIWWPHLLVGLMEIVVALMTKRDRSQRL
ncbi:putative phage tail protein [Pseudorhizobium tarimense]|uniref:Phage tail protein n=1 Tax=Pseudorhizobium tarimense TaxID=1079109 RepID=A0ABV2H308_9HYPH|nr:SPW repeat protein [Pseudorhizobium tarimense]MCJ8518078.1 SPW repeat protein [Pseudorhizobium tarimense]